MADSVMTLSMLGIDPYFIGMSARDIQAELNNPDHDEIDIMAIRAELKRRQRQG